MKTTEDYEEFEEAKEAKEISAEEARAWGLDAQTPDEILDEIEEGLIDYRKLPRREEPAETHELFDLVPSLEEEDKKDPVPDYEDEDGEVSEEGAKLFDEWWLRRAERRHRLFVAEMIAHGNRRLAYQKAYPGVKDNTARINACRLLSNPKVAQAVRDGLVAKKKEEERTLKAVYSGKLAMLEEKRAVLAKLIRCELQLEKEVAHNGNTTTLKQKPGFKDILRAIIVDNKMEEEWQKLVTLPDKGF